MTESFQQLDVAVQAALRTYSNIHRGSGHHALVSTQLYEQARTIVLEHLGLSPKKFSVVFCSPRRAARLQAQLADARSVCLSSQDIGLPLGIRALAIEHTALPKGIPAETGGGTARLVGPGFVIWSNGPHRFEPGTPAIVNVIAFAKALQLVARFGKAAFDQAGTEGLPSLAEPPSDLLAGYAGAELLSRLRPTLVGYEGRVPTVDGERRYANLDNAASTPTFGPIWDAVRVAWRSPSAAQPSMIAEAKSICAEALGASLAKYELLFTSNTTEAINLVAESLGKETKPDSKSVILNTLLEHNSNELPWRRVADHRVIRLPMDSEGFIDLAELESRLRDYNQAHSHGAERITLVAVTGASNVLGVVPPLAEISRIVHHYGARLLVDAAQLIAHRKVEMEDWGIDYLAFSGHKVYAPFGASVLLARKGLLAFTPSEMAAIRASGEENVGGIVGLGKALGLLQRIGFDTIQAEEQALAKRTLQGLATLPKVRVRGLKDPDSPRFSQKGGVVIFDVKGMLPGSVARRLAEEGGIGVRYGCHCAHLAIKRVLGVPAWAEQLQRVMLTVSSRMNLPGVVRVSFGIQNTAEEVDRLLAELGKLTGQARGAKLGRRMGDFVAAAVARVYEPPRPTGP